MSEDPAPATDWWAELQAAREYQEQAELMSLDARNRWRWTLLHAREDGGLGVSELARKLGVSRNYVYQVLAAAERDRSKHADSH